MVETNKEIRRAVDTGKVIFGYKQCKKELAKNSGELLIVTKNMPKNEKETLVHFAKIEGKKVFEFPETGIVLGNICGKPFIISSMIILDKGKSNVDELQ